MKKYFIIAVAAMAAMAACTKVQIDETAAPAKKISFEVAKYMPQTRAALGSGTSMWSEWASPSFYTFAYFYPTTGTGNQTFMSRVQIRPYTSGGAVATSEAETSVWQPAIDYFWPKSGYINFFSYASKNSLGDAVTFADGSEDETKTVSFGTAASPLTIAADDNILLADACYNAAESNSGNDKDNISISGETNTVYGVPTLFRHLLCQVEFEVKLASAKAHAATSYEVDVTSAKLTSDNVDTYGSGLVNNGYLTATSTTKEGASLQIQPWGTSATQAWSEASTPAYEDVVAMTATSTALVLPVQATAGAHESASTHTLLPARTFRPQAIGEHAQFTITYTVRAKHEDVTYSEETLTSTVALATNTPNSGVWRCNDSVTYTIKIDPVTTTVTFDPAVVAWTDVAQDVEI